MTIVDVQGRAVSVDQPVQRIVCLSTGLNEILAVLGAADLVVGRDRRSEFPDTIAPAEVVGDSSRVPQIEAILALQPDLVIADTMLSADSRAKLESFGVPVIVERGTDPERLFAAIENLSLVLEAQARAAEVMDFIQRYEKLIADRVETLEKHQRPRVFWEWRGPYHTGSRASTVDPRITNTGGKNIARDLTGDYPVVSSEFVWERDPQVIVKMASRDDNLESIKGYYDDLTSRLGLRDTAAVRDGRVHILSWDVHNGIRSIIGSLYYAKWFHPELFVDVDPGSIHADLLSQFYSVHNADLESVVYPR